MSEHYDIVVIGGGINGAGIARDAAGRGLSVLLCEKDDLAQHTSSSSTKLIHGGLRYLEYYDFGLVRKALKEREVLLAMAPHIVWPMRFVLPHQKSQRPAWLVRIGLFLYDYIGGRKLLPPTKVLRRKTSDKFAPLKDTFKLAFEYSDCWVEDARLVVLNAMSAADAGARVLTRTKCTGLRRRDGLWDVDLKAENGPAKTVTCTAVINASGPWVGDLIEEALDGPRKHTVRLVKGSHIITRKLYEGDHSYFFQNGDGRIMFAIPYERGEFTLIGTTDVPFEADKDEVVISKEEIDYLCEGASEYFREPIRPSDVVSTYSGVRPLYDDHAKDASAVTRDYVLVMDDEDGAPILSVFGGKITTYRKLAENVLKQFKHTFPDMGSDWTDEEPLPGGDLGTVNFDAYFEAHAGTYPWLDRAVFRRLARAYGTRVDVILAGAKSVEDLGEDYGDGLYQAELDYLVAHEFARVADDVLLRRSKLNLHLDEAGIAKVRAWFAARD